MQKKATKYNLRPTRLQTTWVVIVVLATLVASCDGGLSPPEAETTGVILGGVDYLGPWPDADSLIDLRFVAMRFVPRDTSDFLQLNRIVFSDPLAVGVVRDSFTIAGVRPGVFVYSGIAQQYSSNLFSWRPVGLYEENDGVFHVRGDDTVRIGLHVDFRNLPAFPPPTP